MQAKKLNGKTVIGLTEKVTIYGKNRAKTVTARIDTGATKSSIDKSLASELDLGPVIKIKVIKSAHGVRERPIIKAKVDFAGNCQTYFFSVADRVHMNYKVLIGQNILKKGFLIDPSLK
jgi:hypothetical protein